MPSISYASGEERVVLQLLLVWGGARGAELVLVWGGACGGELVLVWGGASAAAAGTGLAWCCSWYWSGEEHVLLQLVLVLGGACAAAAGTGLGRSTWCCSWYWSGEEQWC